MSIDYSKMTTYIDGKKVKEPYDSSSGEKQWFQWWTKDKEEIGKAMETTVSFIARHQGARIDMLSTSTRLYGSSTSLYNLIAPGGNKSQSVNANPTSQRITYNVIKSCIDTIVNKFASNKVIPMFLPSGGDWKIHRKAEKLNKFSQGWAYDVKLHQTSIDCLRDALVWGTGLIHVFESDGKAKIERVLPHEIFVDLVESFVTQPRSIYRIKMVDRDVAYSLFPDKIDILTQANETAFQDVGGIATSADIVKIVEAYHLPSTKDAKDGKHVISCNGQALVNDAYEQNYFPFVFLHWDKRLLGFWGQGIPEEEMAAQGEINRLLILIQRSMWLGGSFKILVENGSKIVTQHINNNVGSIIFYSGTQPQYISPPMIQPEIYAHINNLVQAVYNRQGVSQLSASSLKPAGLDSGTAIRTMLDNEASRFTQHEQDIEAFSLEVMRLGIQVVKDIYSREKTYKTVFPDKNFVQTIDWKDINLEEDDYVLRAYPTSELPDEPAGRFATVQEWMQAGLISPQAGRKLLSMPDVEMADEIDNAPLNNIEQAIEKMLDGNELIQPEPYWPLDLAKERALKYYNYGQVHKAPEKSLETIREFITCIDNLNEEMIQEQQQQAMAAQQSQQAQSQPQAVPTAPPTSNMIPNVPGVQ